MNLSKGAISAINKISCELYRKPLSNERAPVIGYPNLSMEAEKILIKFFASFPKEESLSSFNKKVVDAGIIPFDRLDIILSIAILMQSSEDK